MSTGRLEAFSDGVIAILITIMVLELHVPRGSDLAAIRPVLPVLLAYVLSFVFLGIYWNNHHHTLSAVTRVSGGVLWANLHLLFWLSLVPFATRWMDEAGYAAVPTAAYATVLLLAGMAYSILVGALVRAEGRDSEFSRALGANVKGKASLGAYVAAIPLAFVYPPLSLAICAGVAVMWLVPDRRFERT
ncbi:MAG: TMEM175 family protein [Candidatus Dormibacteraeota bacterium]|nr:TMEM175 family protein [Candidatus Dormibacteraeota bacterium]